VVPGYRYLAPGIGDSIPYRPIFVSSNRLAHAADAAC
jgi:hypothetical protein